MGFGMWATGARILLLPLLLNGLGNLLNLTSSTPPYPTAFSQNCVDLGLGL